MFFLFVSKFSGYTEDSILINVKNEILATFGVPKTTYRCRCLNDSYVYDILLRFGQNI